MNSTICFPALIGEALAFPSNGEDTKREKGYFARCRLFFVNQEPYFIVTNECTFVDVQLLKMQELPEDVKQLPTSQHLIT